jgi:hypothetical protein
MNSAAMVGALVAVCVGLSSAIAAQSSGWQFARWGMTPMQLGAASHGGVPAGEGSTYDQMTGEYAMGRFKFDVGFAYAPRRDDPGNNDPNNLQLNAVQLNLDFASGTCAELKDYLKTLYGKPDRTFARGPGGMLWNRKAIGDDVEYYAFDDKKLCTVTYMTLGGASS